MDAAGLNRGARAVGLRIGLTGGIGSGKSTVAKLLAGHGAVVVDTDLIARQLTLPGGAAIAAIAAAFGADLIAADGALDRARMREIVFGDPLKKRQLEAILHPLIGTETDRQGNAGSVPAVVFDVPLLVESGGRWRAKVDTVLVVDCHEATQIERVVARSGWTREAVQVVIDQQASRTHRLACADAVIYNDGLSIDALDLQVQTLWQQWSRALR